MRTGGSSPLTRGKQPVQGFLGLPVRLIPARAGKTVARLRRRDHPKAHPRSRGENLLHVGIGHGAAGSSPLARGKPWNGLDADGTPGLIPARAGKTTAARRRGRETWAHPRSRGENGLLSCARAGTGGSSPLARGKRDPGGDADRVEGLIPARAGKTYPRCGGQSPAEAHPRSRGENMRGSGACSTGTGSSPLARGKHEEDGVGAHDGGLIPARAGKT